MALPSSAYGIASFTNPASDLTDYVGFVDLSLLPQAWWDEVTSSDGSRGRVGKDDGTELASHWVNFNDVAQTGQVWFKYSGTLASTGTQEVHVYPPQTGNTAYGVTDTFGSESVWTNRVGQWGFEADPTGTAPQLLDKTGNGHNGTNENTAYVSLAAGQIGNGWDFDGNQNQAVSVPYDVVFDLDGTEDWAVFGWIAPEFPGARFQYLISYGGVAVANSLNLLVNNASDDGFVRALVGSSIDISSTSQITSGVLTHVGVHYESSTDTVRLLFNGQTQDNTSFTGTLQGSSTDIIMGNRNDLSSSRYVTGIMDEWGFAKGISVDYITHTYSNQNDPATFWGTWTVEGGGGGGDESITVTDSASGSDEVLPTASLSVGDQGDGNDSVTPNVSLSVSDEGSGDDSPSPSAQTTVQDSATGLDALQALVVANVSDVALSEEGISAQVNVVTTDSGQFVDVVSVLVSVLKQVQDSGSFTDSTSVNAEIKVQDLGQVSEVVGVLVDAIRVSDTAQVVEIVASFDDSTSVAKISIKLKPSPQANITLKSSDINFDLKTNKINIKLV